MDTIPTIRAEDATEIQRLRSLKYEEYLQTPHWRRTRDAALRRAGFSCSNSPCRERSNLQVHHRSYDRIGCERPDDLTVLCRRCHEGHHRDEAVKLGVYLRLGSELLREASFTSSADFTEALAARLRVERIVYDSQKVRGVVDLLSLNRFSTPKGTTHRPRPKHGDYRPYSLAESHDLLELLGKKFSVTLREMPAGHSDLATDDDRKRIQAQKVALHRAGEL